MTDQQHTPGTATVHGQTIPLTPIDDGGVVTDVIVIVRAVEFDDDGRAHDSIYVDATRSTTEVLHTGMLAAAHQIAAADWELAEED